jgi:hypothetical protein
MYFNLARLRQASSVGFNMEVDQGYDALYG